MTLSQKGISKDQYEKMHHKSLNDPENFWSGQAEKFITWFKRWDKVKDGDFTSLNLQWFIGGKLNACYNCIDRHLESNPKKTALIFEGNDPSVTKNITYSELYTEVCKFANVLKSKGIKKGDRVAIYMPMIPEAAIAMLACARIGAVHTVVFAGFSANALQNRIEDADCSLVITADESRRGNKTTPLKKNVDTALSGIKKSVKVILIKNTGADVSFNKDTDTWYHEAYKDAAPECPCEMMDSEDPFFILYTSGSTGKPKGIVHSVGGYLVYAAMTHKYIFNYKKEDIYWCTADIGWITGHTYSIYGPLCNAATSLIFEGVPNFPTPARIWEVVDKHQVNILYTAPTAIRALRAEGDDWVAKTSRKSLKILGTVGEPINPDVWQWYFDIVGNKRCYIVDTWWQTETGGIILSPIPYATTLKPGAASWPFFGVSAKICDDEGNELPKNTMGNLVITTPWPSMMQTIYKNRKKFADSYFEVIKGTYFTGDNAKQDNDNYFWITGRNDDVINISGHRIGTGEVENAFLTHPEVSEVGIVSQPHEIKGESLYAFVILKKDAKPSNELEKSIIDKVRHEISAIATPEHIHFTKDLPKTRSGKIMRRLLKKIANNSLDNLGDTSTLANPEIVDVLIKECKETTNAN